jgi:hypothetical protein
VKVTGFNSELADAGNKEQLPMNAPARFRRVRTSKGFLVPKIKSDEYTGKLLQVPAVEVAASIDHSLSKRAERAARAVGLSVDPLTGEVACDLIGQEISVPRVVASGNAETIAQEDQRLREWRAYDEKLIESRRLII